MSKMSEVKVCLCPPFPRSWVDEAFCSKMLHPHCRSALAWCHGCGSRNAGFIRAETGTGTRSWNQVPRPELYPPNIEQSPADTDESSRAEHIRGTLKKCVSLQTTI